MRPLARSFSTGLLRRTMTSAATAASSSGASGERRTYAQAIELLNSLQSNAQDVAAIQALLKAGFQTGPTNLADQAQGMRRLGYQDQDLNRLNAIHITGTKGKGSTSAFVTALLRSAAAAGSSSSSSGESTRIGLYTSPHLVSVRERIRINGTPIAEDLFARYFFEVWDRLEQNPQREHMDKTPLRPPYFRFLTLVAMHAFLQEKVDASVFEVGIGGTYDSTNIIPQPIATGVSPLGLDHVHLLGNTIPEIATQKGGIYKPGVPALAIEQPQDGLTVLASRARELGASSFTVVPVHPALQELKLGIAGVHQRSNASLALALVFAFLKSPRVPSSFSAAASELSEDTEAEEKTGAAPVSAAATVAELAPLPRSLIAPQAIPQRYVEALERTRWPGRCQEARDPKASNVVWFLDGAHTTESLLCCAQWFNDAAVAPHPSRRRALIFNCTSGRSGRALLRTIVEALRRSANGATLFQDVIFCTNTTFTGGASASDLVSRLNETSDAPELALQRELAQAWESLAADMQRGQQQSTQTSDSALMRAEVHVLPSIEDAVTVVRDRAASTGEPIDALVAGSLHLVGGALAVTEVPLEL